MNAAVTLTRRESEVAELFAWGGAKKDVADMLCVSQRTVENHARNIYEKIGCGKVNELSAWWFCTHFNISFDLSPLKRRVMAAGMAALMFFAEFGMKEEFVRVRVRQSTAREAVCRCRQRSEDFNFLEV